MAIKHTALTVFWRFLILGCYSFGGPTAHLGYFHREFVEKRGWLDEKSYAEIVALCQFLPGPASSQVGMSIGLQQAGWRGAIAAFTGFTLPSVLLMLALVYGYGQLSEVNGFYGMLHGIKIFAVAVVLDAVLKMKTSLCPTRSHLTIALLTAIIMLLVGAHATHLGTVAQLGSIGIAALLGLKFYQNKPDSTPASIQEPSTSIAETSATGRSALPGTVLLGGLLLGLPIIASWLHSPLASLFDSYFRTGSLVFGGGHVVLPMLQSEVVASGQVTENSFLMGYSAAQAVPGPMFVLSTFLGGMTDGVNSLTGALTATIAIFLPSFLLLAAAWPYWKRMQAMPQLRGALQGVNAAVVGLLLAAFYNPVWTMAITSATDVALVVVAWLLLTVWKTPVVWVVAGFAGMGAFLL